MVHRPSRVVVVLVASAALLIAIPIAPAAASGSFNDDNSSVHEGYIEAIAAEGITKGCNPPVNNRFCPSDPVTRGQMAAFLNRALDLAAAPDDRFTDDDDSVFEDDIQALAAAGITRGCNPPINDHFCPDASVTRGQMAAFLVRGFAYTDTGDGDLFTDDDGLVFETDIDKLGTAGVTKGCNPPGNDRFCSHSVVTREEMASLLGRALGLTPIEPEPGLGGHWGYVGVQSPEDANSTLTANFGYAPWGYDPASIPVPSTNTHYVDNTAGNCSDAGNGTTAVPRCSIPTDLAAGDVVQIEGGPYAGSHQIVATGTVAEPVFIHGDGVISGIADNDHAIEITGSSHLIIDGIEFDGSTIAVNDRGNGAFSIRGDSHHVTLRNSIIHDYPDPLELAGQPGRSRFFANGVVADADYVAIVNNSFTDIGSYPPTYETGKHIIAGGSNSDWVWIVGNEFVRGSEDAIQIRANSDDDPNTFWTIAANDFESMGENAIDIKTGSHNIVTSNRACDFHPVSFANGSGSDGSAFVFNNDNGGPRESWMINNLTTTCLGVIGGDGTVNVGFRMQSEEGTNYIVGNIFNEVVDRAIYVGSGSVPVIEMNTIYSSGDDGILVNHSGSPGGSVLGNIVYDAGDDAINLNQSYMAGWAQFNVVFDPDGPVDTKNVTAPTNLIDVDPMMIDPAGVDFALGYDSPAASFITTQPVSWGVFHTLYGFSIAYDWNRAPRTEPYSAGAFG